MLLMDMVLLQKKVCLQHNVDYWGISPYLKVGIAENVKQKIYPINGLRLPPEGDTTGWYIWAGNEISEKPDFFLPLHVSHLDLWCAEIIPYLGLPPGWRFLIAPNYLDVWYDSDLLSLPSE